MPGMRLTLFRALPIALVLSAAACGGTTSTGEQPAAQTAQATRAPVAPNAQGHMKLVAAALSDVPLRPDQRADIEKMAADADARHAEAADARKQVMLALADQVQAGQVDRAALQPKIDAMAAALEKSRPADRAAIEHLHAILTPDQRVAFVDALQAKMHDRMAAAHEGHHGGGMGEMAKDLNLTDEQKQKIHEAMRARFHGEGHDGDRDGDHHGPPPEMREHMDHGRNMLEAFKQDHFSMDEVAPQRDVHQDATKMSDHILGMVEIVLPILTPEQRTIAAQKLREHAQKMADDDHPPM